MLDLSINGIMATYVTKLIQRLNQIGRGGGGGKKASEHMKVLEGSEEIIYVITWCRKHGLVKETLASVVTATEIETASSVTELWLMKRKTQKSCKENRAGTAKVAGANI